MSSTDALVEVFTGPNCAHCAAAKALLTDRGVAFVELDISIPDNRAEFFARLPRARQIPQIFVRGQHIGNDEDLRIAFDRGRMTGLESG